MMNVKIMELKHAILDKNAEISRLMGEMAFQKRELTEKQIYILSLERQLSEAKKEAQNYKNVLIGQGFENLDSLAYETRDTTQIGVIAKQRTEQIIAQLAEARAEVEKLKRMTPTDAIAMRTSSVKQAHREGWEQAKAEAKMLSFSYSCHKDIAAMEYKGESK